ncbi:TPA: DNA mismatch repair endonuclease MutL [Candidatus Dojkabacteria bacterium]|uniref:DNA mismatch repair protein MutL n=1 Tax=Candidatus Dojkabacteria bacterium TaxID=2099670 RepID=A0A832R916_9BACT|nr:DNA mismatch repair endonuclease MutL [Candidatus Dojkabacteria bacterium]
MKGVKLNKLSDEVVRQIAAGEVIERPASVVKELVDNSIDAKASKITVKVKNGGIDLIEVSDDGIGIPKENLPLIFQSHTTSKLNSIEDLNTLLSMGFRGEALSTITSVAKVRTESKYEEEERANAIFFNEKGASEISTIAKEKGTTIKVENLFYNIPARAKYLKTANTEYRKIFEMLNRYFLIYPDISFTLEKDGKTVIELNAITHSKAGELHEERVREVLGKDFSDDMLKLRYEGSGIKISGFVSHPSKFKKKATNQYIFVNNRPITDRGIVRAVMEGYSRYLPFGQRIDFVINININPELVDVNVHPRKEEVRFENPFRIYSAVEEAVRHVLEKNLSYRNEESKGVGQIGSDIDFKSIRETYNTQVPQTSLPRASEGVKQYQQQSLYSQNKPTSVQDSIMFSKELFKEIEPVEENQEQQDGDIRSIFQIFNKYIVIEFTNEKLWMIDQHAAAERINFEKLINREKNQTTLQNLLVPVEIPFSKKQIIFLKDSKDFFEDLGFLFDIKSESILLKTIPAEYAEADFETIFLDIFELEDNIELLGKSLKKRKEDILATIACHGSIRTGKSLAHQEMLNLFHELKACDNAYSCPHGRPIIWKLTLSEIDNHFERTY